MSGPLSQVLGFDSSLELLVGLLVGVGFGFTLERAGFGRSDNLAAIFYGRDFRVMRVMFTAIVTAMLGLYFLDLVGVLPLYTIGLLDTYVLPQLAGGLLLGAGFIVGGYCPGTSIVGAASGKLDAVFFLIGLALGSAGALLAASPLQPFMTTTAMGRVLLNEYLGVSSGIVVFGVVLFAIGCFAAVGKVEQMVTAGRVAR